MRHPLRKLAAAALLIMLTVTSVRANAETVRSFAPDSVQPGGLPAWFAPVVVTATASDPVVVHGGFFRLWTMTFAYLPFWNYIDGAPFTLTASALRWSVASGTDSTLPPAPVTTAFAAPASPERNVVPQAPPERPTDRAPAPKPAGDQQQGAPPEEQYDMAWWYAALKKGRTNPPAAPDETTNPPAKEPAPVTPEPAPAPGPAPVPPPPTAPRPQPKPVPVPAPEPAPPEQVDFLTADERQMLDLINEVRGEVGLPALQADLALTKVARLKSQDMIDHNYFSHQSPTYGSPFDMMKRFGITYRTAGENLAGNQTVERAHAALMNSPGHRANILGQSFTQIGIGIVKGGRYGMMFTQLFRG